MSARSDFPDFQSLALPQYIVRDLRSDHAGETGAVAIYEGILAVSRNPEVIRFARHHRETEQRHLDFFEAWLPGRHKSSLGTVWKLAGFLLGALPAFLGRRAVYSTVAAVESFVVKHYEDQIRKLDAEPRWAALSARLREFQLDEDDHRRDAARRGSRPGLMTRAWSAVVGAGSAAGVAAARLI